MTFNTKKREKPYAQSCDENKHVILEAIRPHLLAAESVLEIASGTGQHAIYFAEQLPHLTWQPSDLADNLPGMRLWIEEAKLNNILPPLALNVSSDAWPQQSYDALFSANSFHIMAESHLEDFFANLAQVLNSKGKLLIYGPFNYNHCFTSDSNERFDAWLKQRNPESGIKDFEWCQQLAEQAGLNLQHDIAMPQNNRVLVWQKVGD